MLSQQRRHAAAGGAAAHRSAGRSPRKSPTSRPRASRNSTRPSRTRPTSSCSRRSCWPRRWRRRSAPPTDRPSCRLGARQAADADEPSHRIDRRDRIRAPGVRASASVLDMAVTGADSAWSRARRSGRCSAVGGVPLPGAGPAGRRGRRPRSPAARRRPRRRRAAGRPAGGRSRRRTRRRRDRRARPGAARARARRSVGRRPAAHRRGRADADAGLRRPVRPRRRRRRAIACCWPASASTTADSEDAIRALPARGHAGDLALRRDARDRCWTRRAGAGHEYLLSIPMEPQGYPLNDPGPRALLTSLPLGGEPPSGWTGCCRASTGYVGATGALGGMRGERFAAVPEQMDPVLADARRARPAVCRSAARRGRSCRMCGRARVDLVIDDPPSAAEIEAQAGRTGAASPATTAAALGLVGAIASGHHGAHRAPGRAMGWRGAASRWRRSARRRAAAAGHPPAAEEPRRRNERAALPGECRRGAVQSRAAWCSSPAAPTCRTPRAPPGGWQLPQGGIDAGEDPRGAVLRELAEEIGTDRAEIIGEHPDWLTYDLPPRTGRRGAGRALSRPAAALVRAALHRRRRATSGWTWTRTRNSTPGAGRELAELPALAVDFKRPIYEVLAASFARFAAP